ncbi:epithelial cell-transforming sequence 2 oncogene-like isoform X2 [Dasypus novemcinctus]|uniref:epithelial cell-transforming sequence 2 oncogene-like isoform X2 n=1 Tax=Dasypus novemcinctus TaxID=9361 RepID=UPI00265EEEB1|nr:epithelial cell-transforming sequence 2 oncogene-like isoform X2 [Dasypus novemcinctus]
MSVEDSSREILEMESFHTRFSAWTPFSNKSLNSQLFQERVTLISHWFDLWTNKQRQEFLSTIFLRCGKSQLRFVQDWFSERKEVAKVDFSTVLPRCISLYIFSFLNPKDLCAAAQVSWPWKFLAEQDCLWRPKCTRFGWFLPYTPAEKEYGAWKHHYLACLSTLDWLTPREAAALYGTLNEPKAEDEELWERHREKCLRKIIWGKIALRKKELFKVRPPWVSGTCCSRLLKSRCQPRLSQSVKGRVELQEAGEKQLIRTSLDALPKRSNVSGSHSYPLLPKKNERGVYKNYDDSSALQPHLILISSRIPAYEMVVDSVRAGVAAVVYEHSGLTLEGLLRLTAKALAGRRARSIGIFSDGNSREVHLLQGYKIGIKNLLKPEVRDFWEKLGSSVATAEEGGHVDLFVPLAASEDGMEILSQLSQLTGTLFSAPTGIATGSYQHILSAWLGPQRQGPPPAVYFCESKLQAWHRFADLLEDALRSVRTHLGPVLRELQRRVSGRLVGQLMFDTMSVASILENEDTAQALADGLTELSREHRDQPLEFLSSFLLKKCSKRSKDFEGNDLPEKRDPKAARGSFPKENVMEDNSQDTTSCLRSKGLNSGVLVELERTLRLHPAEARARVAGELLRSERGYVQTLETARAAYVAPLRAALASNRAILSAANLEIIFADLLRILSLNRRFLDDLGARLRSWGPAHCVGDIVVRFGSRLDVYTNFFNNYPVVLETIEKCRDATPAFRAFLKRREKTAAARMLSLPELLVRPSRRFGEYVQLLCALRLHTPAQHADRGDLTAAVERMRTYAGYVEQMKENFRRKDEMSDIQRSIRGCPTLSEVNRYLIRVQDVAQLHCCDEEISFSLRQLLGQNRKKEIVPVRATNATEAGTLKVGHVLLRQILACRSHIDPPASRSRPFRASGGLWSALGSASMARLTVLRGEGGSCQFPFLPWEQG